MEFTFTFLMLFAHALHAVGPLLVFFSFIIIVLGQWVGRIEGWSRFDALYWSFITATTVGYGDIPPTRKITKILAIWIAFTGLLFTGLFVAAMLETVSRSFSETDRLEQMQERLGVSPESAYVLPVDPK